LNLPARGLAITTSGIFSLVSLGHGKQAVSAWPLAFGLLLLEQT